MIKICIYKCKITDKKRHNTYYLTQNENKIFFTKECSILEQERVKGLKTILIPVDFQRRRKLRREKVDFFH